MITSKDARQLMAKPKTIRCRWLRPKTGDMKAEISRIKTEADAMPEGDRNQAEFISPLSPALVSLLR